MTAAVAGEASIVAALAFGLALFPVAAWAAGSEIGAGSARASRSCCCAGAGPRTAIRVGDQGSVTSSTSSDRMPLEPSPRPVSLRRPCHRWPAAAPLYPGGEVYLEAFHGGRIAGSVVTPELTMVAIEADLAGNRVHTTTEAADTLFLDAGTTMAGVAHTFGPENYELRIWDNGEPTADLAGNADFNAAPRPTGLTDDGPLAATIRMPGTTQPRAMAYHRAC